MRSHESFRLPHYQHGRKGPRRPLKGQGKHPWPRKHFEKEYRNFYVKGESKDKDVGMPFLIKNRSKRMGVVLIHGYMAAPLEVKMLAAHLGQKGFWVYAPRLRGHGTSPDDLAGRTYMDWVESVDEGYAILRNICKRVVVGGFSTGAGLALDLAARMKKLAGVFAVSPPLRLQDFSVRFVSSAQEMFFVSFIGFFGR